MTPRTPASNTVFVLARIRGWFDGAGWFLAGAAGLFLVALLAAVLSLQVDNLMWTGQAVHGTERGGIVYYTWHGQSYNVDDMQGLGNGTNVTVYINPADPGTAVIDNPTDRMITYLVVGLPVLAGVGLLVMGATRKYRWQRRNAKRGTSDWWMSQIPR